MRFSKSSKYSTVIFELTFTTEEANASSILGWLFCSVVPFLVNFFPKTQIVSLSRNLVPKLFQLCRIPWWCSLFLFLTGNTFFWKNLTKRVKTVNLSWNLVPSLIWICRIQWQFSLFLFQTKKSFLRQISSKNPKLPVQGEVWYKD